MPTKDKLRDELLDAGEQGASLLIGGLRDGRFTPEELEEALVEVLTATVDAVIPTGPIDPVDDDLIRAGVAGVYRAIADALERDPTRMRARATKVLARGNEARAKRIEARAAALEARRA